MAAEKVEEGEEAPGMAVFPDVLMVDARASQWPPDPAVILRPSLEQLEISIS